MSEIYLLVSISKNQGSNFRNFTVFVITLEDDLIKIQQGKVQRTENLFLLNDDIEIH